MTTTMTKLLNFDAVEKAPLTTDPFSFMVARDVIPADMLERVNADYPHIDRPANFKPESLEYGPLFAQILEDLDSPEFERLISRKFDIDLTQTTKTITVRKLSEPSDGNIHTDHWSKIMTVLLYFNPEWHQEGGKLRMLRGKHDIEDYVAEVTPLGGTLLAFKRSNNSYHGYKRFDGERRMVQVNWVRSDPLALQAQRISRLGTHTGKKLLRMAKGLGGRG
ncbi:2OG-Fe(II) oxygenase [Roseovarius autotrophicus]|uniref:2OG-Fe(II) oxygenase n=1 Tax=Roseovarius autotrophicus TaxID=2824121 RepID=UPI001B36BB41|nr:2OG-Fe(II) oxygenase [Roseovarius autotrophicus]